ncbi:SDR family NAD(P)-dependent oxidoreductase [Mycobacterium camsae]|uniref:SDR family NAD(P)-dependent oxidoreductase n=1 Tax=Mycobacterium gordonae TaxID=1778 RepID=UPI002402801F|nr:SDR family NAD(P)-dependent oxidoreductase [Mycobacterium gordonae]
MAAGTDLQGKVAVVTGGAGGIGRALGRRFAQEGMKMLLADVLAEPLDAATRELKSAGFEVAGLVTDVTDYSSVEALANEALQQFGAVHVVFNNPGTGGVSEGYLWEHDLADWRWGIDVNVLGVIHDIKAFVPILLEQGEGHVVNTCSGNGGFAPIARGAMGGPANAVYPMTKAAVLCLTEVYNFDLRALAALADRIGPTPQDLGQDDAVSVPKWEAPRQTGRHWLTGADPLPDLVQS